MLEGAAADTVHVYTVLRLIATACTFLLLASFTLFVRDQLVTGSVHQQNDLRAINHQSQIVLSHPKQHAQPRRFIDAVAQSLNSPWNSVVNSNSPWVTTGIPTLISLLVYGVGIGYLARFSRGFAHGHHPGSNPMQI